MKTPVDQLKLDGTKATDPQISVNLNASSPLQITLTRASLELVKSLADVRWLAMILLLLLIFNGDIAGLCQGVWETSGR